MKKIIALALSAVMALSMVACGGETKTETHELKIATVQTAAHGTKCFASVTAVVEGDTIVAAYIDEYQYMGGEVAGVPNSESFAETILDGKKLVSKRAENEIYSANMAAAGSTVEIAANYDAVQAHVAGKTIADVEALALGDAQAAIDAVAGCTLADTRGYLGAVVTAAKAAQAAPAVTVEGSLEGYTLKRVLGAAHGTKCFAEVAAFTNGEKVALAFIDEYQFMAAEDVTGVPNTESLAANLAEGKALISKRAENDYYSAKMAAAGSTVTIAANYDAIQAHVAGKAIADLEAEIAGELAADAVAGCTLVDAAGYIRVILEAAKA